VSRWRIYLAAGTSIVLATTAGVIASQTFGAGSQTPAETVTINVATGPKGDTGPPGPAGQPGAENCPTGSVFGELVINHPGGQTTILTCIKHG
jgi:hypothetical protein